MVPFPFKDFQRQLLLKMMLLQHNHSSRLYWTCQRCVKRQIVVPNSRLLSTFDSIRSNIFSLDICQTFSTPSHTLPILHPYSHNKKNPKQFLLWAFLHFPDHTEEELLLRVWENKVQAVWTVLYPGASVFVRWFSLEEQPPSPLRQSWKQRTRTSLCTSCIYYLQINSNQAGAAFTFTATDKPLPPAHLMPPRINMSMFPTQSLTVNPTFDAKA